MPKGIISQAWLERLVLQKLYLYAQEQEGPGLSSNEIKETYNLQTSKKRIELALAELKRLHLVDESFEYQDAVYSIQRKGYVQVETESNDPDTFTGQYFLNGDDWLVNIAGVDVVPASDRIVFRSDNSTGIAGIEKQLSDLEEEIIKSNSVEEALGEPKSVSVGEINSARVLLKADGFYLKRLLGLILPLLQKLSKSFGTAALGALAKQLIEEIMKLI